MGTDYCTDPHLREPEGYLGICNRDCSSCRRMRAEFESKIVHDQKIPSVEFVGILGGMGPLATLDLLKKIADQTEGDRDQDHIPMIVLADPSTPDRTASILDENAPSSLPFILSAIEKLNRSGASVIAMPCNTAHHWLTEIKEISKVPILNMVELTCRHITGILPRGSVVGILGTQGTISAGIYQHGLSEVGLQSIVPSESACAGVSNAIDAVKANRIDEGKEALCFALTELADAGAAASVLACTELPLIWDLIAASATVDMHVVDPTAILARECLRAGEELRSRNRSRFSPDDCSLVLGER